MELKIAALQMVSTRDVAENLDKATQMIAEAASNGTQVVVLPEFFAKITTSEDPYRTSHSEMLNNGSIQGHLKAMAMLYSVYIIAGSILLDSHIQNKFYCFNI